MSKSLYSEYLDDVACNSMSFKEWLEELVVKQREEIVKLQKQIAELEKQWIDMLAEDQNK